MRTAPPNALIRLRRMLGHLLTAALAALGALGTALGTGLAMIGLCCGTPVLTAAGAGAAAGTAGAVTHGPAVWPFFTAAAVLFTAAWLLHRRTTRRGCRTSPEQTPASRPHTPDHTS
ncbi:hypothetical protein ABZ628_27385 [Streptomyces diastaticus]|uniref:Uncharacterized protein n=1 Tax=Pseudonocardia dioxanivorans (strain ATCC 55486 / DSM 44775 / JCM 13855 / CB1190) TaxID=675635 RepID=F2L6S7_PSEUX|nr:MULTISPECIES: hypothetical protein [Actinomycetes]AEA28799.1 hypothetical protein Psed_6716 [Pseudonocardia dioxanivorans CB1190]OSP38774.1 hypothetical protein B7767_35245 [Streptomyces sp. 13-12-16]GJF03560.1 hypothetical protein PSD17_25200 [Pseudonocardia sp. D17]